MRESVGAFKIRPHAILPSWQHQHRIARENLREVCREKHVAIVAPSDHAVHEGGVFVRANYAPAVSHEADHGLLGGRDVFQNPSHTPRRSVRPADVDNRHDAGGGS